MLADSSLVAGSTKTLTGCNPWHHVWDAQHPHDNIRRLYIIMELALVPYLDYVARRERKVWMSYSMLLYCLVIPLLLRMLCRRHSISMNPRQTCPPTTTWPNHVWDARHSHDNTIKESFTKDIKARLPGGTVFNERPNDSTKVRSRRLFKLKNHFTRKLIFLIFSR